MDEPPGIKRYLPWIVFVGAAFAFGIAYAFVGVHLSTLGWLNRVVEADHLVEGPAIYRGRLVGPSDRVDPLGEPAVIHWGWVESTDSDSDVPECATQANDGISLETEAGTYRLSWLEKPVQITSVTHDMPSAPAVIDLGKSAPRELEEFPGPFQPCAGDHRKLTMYAIPPGTTVEVLACASQGELGPCKGGLENVLSTDGMKAHRARRADEIATAFRVAVAIALALSIAMGIWAAAHRAKVFEQLRPEGRR
ncbi:MAG: hypothetical protein U0414_06985 [Polyangiaceae bacterium]